MSALKSEELAVNLRPMENSVSMIGRPRTIIGVSKATAVELFWQVAMETTASVNPRNWLPVSPINIVAG